MKTDPRKLLENVGVARRDLFKNVLALRAIVAESEAKLITLLQSVQNTPPGPQSPNGDPFDASNAVSVLRGMLYDHGPHYAASKLVLELGENSKEFKEASEEIEPLLAAIAILDADAEKLRLEKARIKAELNAALEAANKRALSAAENDPAVLDAKKKLQSLDAKL